MPSEENKSKERKAAESEVESFRKDLGPTGYDNDTLLDDYRSFPVLQKPFHRDGIERHARESAHAKDVESRIGASGYYEIVALRPASTCCCVTCQSGNLLDSATPQKI